MRVTVPARRPLMFRLCRFGRMYFYSGNIHIEGVEGKNREM